MFGFLVIDKRSGITSRAAINPIGRTIGRIKIGHCGTLDPLATGVLVVALGPATRLVPYVQQMPKSYTATFRLGWTSDTEDIEGKVTPAEGAPIITATELEAALPQFIGKISQLPPQYSALRVQGKRAYELARAGKTVQLKPRQIDIFQLELTRFEYPDFEIKVQCGSGTYVRSLGRDIGAAVGSSAIMTTLDRTAIGVFSKNRAIAEESPDRETIATQLISPREGVGSLPTFPLSDDQVAGLLNGVPIRVPEDLTGDEFAGLDRQGRLMALLRRKQKNTLTPAINFAHYWSPLPS